MKKHVVYPIKPDTRNLFECYVDEHVMIRAGVGTRFSSYQRLHVFNPRVQTKSGTDRTIIDTQHKPWWTRIGSGASLPVKTPNDTSVVRFYVDNRSPVLEDL